MGINKDGSGLTGEDIPTINNYPSSMIKSVQGNQEVYSYNNINRIDSALLREGRFDVKIELHKFIDCEVKEMLTKMYAPKYSEIINNVEFPDKLWSPSRIRNICHGYDDTEEGILKIIADEDRVVHKDWIHYYDELPNILEKPPRLIAIGVDVLDLFPFLLLWKTCLLPDKDLRIFLVFVHL